MELAYAGKYGSRHLVEAVLGDDFDSHLQLLRPKVSEPHLRRRALAELRVGQLDQAAARARSHAGLTKRLAWPTGRRRRSLRSVAGRRGCLLCRLISARCGVLRAFCGVLRALKGSAQEGARKCRHVNLRATPQHILQDAAARVLSPPLGRIQEGRRHRSSVRVSSYLTFLFCVIK